MANPEDPQFTELEQNKRQAAMALAQRYQSSSRGFSRLQDDADKATKCGQVRFLGWMVGTYHLAVELWDEALVADKIGAARVAIVDRRPRPKPKPKPTIPRPENPLPAIPMAKVPEKPLKLKREPRMAETSKERIERELRGDGFPTERSDQIHRELTGEVDLEPKKAEVFKMEPFFTDRDEIVVIERTPGVFGQYYQHPFDHSPRIFTDDKQPRASKKTKK